MSAYPSRCEVLGLSLLASDAPRDFGALVDAILEFYEAIGRRPKWFTGLTRTWRPGSKAFRPKAFRDFVLDGAAETVHLGPEKGASEHVIGCYLRAGDPKFEEYVQRWVSLTATRLAFDHPAVRTLIARLIDIYPIAQGAIAGYRSLAYAAKESSFSGAVSGSELDEATRARLHEDQMLGGRFLRRVRRLYPITIIGPKLWAELPPMPALDPMPVVEEIGDCRLLRVWPTLVEPRDPEFLAGTTELRRWLWPYTIQNPADAIEPEKT